MQDHPLALLIAPLKIAAKDVERVRGLEQVVAAAVERAGPGEPQSEIARLAQGFDEKPPEEKREIVARIARALGATIALPPELVAVAGAGTATGSAAGTATGTATSLSLLQGIGPARAAAFEKRGLRTVQDLLYFLPNRYEDRRRITTIRDAPWTGRIVVVGRCTKVDVRRIRGGGRKLLEAVFADETGSLEGVWFNFYPSLQARLERPPRLFVLSGDVKKGFRGKRSLAHPDLEELPEDSDGGARSDSLSFGRVVPVYGEIEGVHSKTVRRITKHAVDAAAPSVDDVVPPELRSRLHLLPLGRALAEVHYPPADASVDALNAFASPAHDRLIFDELFFLQVGLALRKRGVKIEPGFAFDTSPRIVDRALKRLPFTLTGAQRTSVDDILSDMKKPQPMHRLLQGDVGSGKTAVAVVACLVAVANRKQAAIMAPTEILAEQHERTVGKILAGTGLEPPLLTASTKTREATRIKAGLRDGTIPIVVGTHALLTEGVDFADLGLVVVDEQHRFGVMQRMKLIQKGRRPDVLVMTATPIPRTLAMTLYGDLDVSVIDELPPGRTPVTTKVWSMQKREQVYEVMKKELRAGRQAYVVLPLVEESESEELARVRDATRAYEELSQGPLKEFRVGLIHGRMNSRERDLVMDAFRAAKLDVLVATTVIEVGVDVPNATVMVVEHAERFGLSQLHQLRGRVGRGAAKSWCHLVADWGTDKSRSRLSVMGKTQDGFKISEADLQIRGPGELIGTKQSGLPDLTVASLGRDQKILEIARREAFALVEADPDLAAPENRSLGEAVRARWAGKLSVGRVG